MSHADPGYAFMLGMFIMAVIALWRSI